MHARLDVSSKSFVNAQGNEFDVFSSKGLCQCQCSLYTPPQEEDRIDLRLRVSTLDNV